jgi:YidC/Oxa1 family membrane protein insertase
MDMWSSWVDLIWASVQYLSADVGLGAGLSIIAMTVLLRVVILPLTWQITYRGQIRQRKLALLQPELLQLKERYTHDPQQYAAAMIEAYRRRGLTLIDGRSLLGAFVQMPIVLGMFSALRHGLTQGRFLWVANLAKPDLVLALLAGFTTGLLMFAAPDLPDHLRLMMLIVPAVLMVLAALQFSSGIALYWATSNVLSAAQTVAVRTVVTRRVKSGKIAI